MEQISLFANEKLAGKAAFFAVAGKCERPGMRNVLAYLEHETDFFTAPASARYHGAYEGGLVEHSLRVYCRLRDMAPPEVAYDSIIITSLFHDICKANFYTVSTRNVKNKETGRWEQVPFYAIEEELPYGAHGGKSVYLLQREGLELTDEEAIAINCHMGGWDVTSYHSPSKAFEKYPLALYLHIADMVATSYDNC